MPLIDLNSMEDLDGLVPLWQAMIGGYLYVLYNDNKVVIHKGDGSTYQIDEHGCSCPAAQYGNANCKHRTMFTWVGDGAPTTKVTEEVSVSVDGLL